MSIREIKKHIHATKEIVRITNVMYLQAASRLSKVRKRREQAQRYFKEILHLVSFASANVKKKDIDLLMWRPTRTMLYVVITPRPRVLRGTLKHDKPLGNNLCGRATKPHGKGV